MLATAGPVVAQEEAAPAPFFEQVPAVMYETYQGVNQPAFDDYFRMLVAKYTATGGAGWAVYRENPKVSYRITVLPEGLASVPEIQQARVRSFQEFDDDQMALWNAGWETRHAAIYNAAPRLSYVPDGFTLEDIRQLPYHRTSVYHLKWDQGAAFRDALAARAQLDRDHGIEGFVLTAWNGGFGTVGQTVMIRVSAESLVADRAALAQRMEIRQAYLDEFRRLTRIMNDASWHIDRHDQRRQNELSYTPDGG
jgi:hypothetical protein